MNSLDLVLPRIIRDGIDEKRGKRSRASYIIKCIDYILRNNIDINEHNEGNNDKTTGLTRQ